MNTIYHPDKSPQKYESKNGKSFTIAELKEIVEGTCEILYLPLESAYIIFNKEFCEKKINGYNIKATDKIKENYDDSPTKIFGKAIITNNI